MKRSHIVLRDNDAHSLIWIRLEERLAVQVVMCGIERDQPLRFDLRAPAIKLEKPALRKSVASSRHLLWRFDLSPFKKYS